MSEDKERMRMEPDRMAEPDEDKDVEGHRFADTDAGRTAAREDEDDVEGHRFADTDAGRTAAREDDDDDDVEGHQMASQNVP